MNCRFAATNQMIQNITEVQRGVRQFFGSKRLRKIGERSIMNGRFAATNQTSLIQNITEVQRGVRQFFGSKRLRKIGERPIMNGRFAATNQMIQNITEVQRGVRQFFWIQKAQKNWRTAYYERQICSNKSNDSKYHRGPERRSPIFWIQKAQKNWRTVYYEGQIRSNKSNYSKYHRGPERRSPIFWIQKAQKNWRTVYYERQICSNKSNDSKYHRGPERCSPIFWIQKAQKNWRTAYYERQICSNKSNDSKYHRGPERRSPIFWIQKVQKNWRTAYYERQICSNKSNDGVRRFFGSKRLRKIGERSIMNGRFCSNKSNDSKYHRGPERRSPIFWIQKAQKNWRTAYYGRFAATNQMIQNITEVQRGVRQFFGSKRLRKIGEQPVIKAHPLWYGFETIITLLWQINWKRKCMNGLKVELLWNNKWFQGKQSSFNTKTVPLCSKCAYYFTWRICFDCSVEAFLYCFFILRVRVTFWAEHFTTDRQLEVIANYWSPIGGDRQLLIARCADRQIEVIAILLIASTPSGTCFEPMPDRHL